MDRHPNHDDEMAQKIDEETVPPEAHFCRICGGKRQVVHSWVDPETGYLYEEWDDCPVCTRTE